MSDSSVQSVKNQQGPVEVTYAPPRRPPRWGLSAAFRAWARGTFSRESLVSSLKSLGWVVPLTVLIWIYAEREQVVTLNNVAVSIEPRSTDAARFVRLVSPAGGTIHAELKGPQAEIDQVKDWLESNSVNIDVDHNLTPGEHQISITNELNRLPRVMQKGVTVMNCVPADVRVFVDPVEQAELEVRVRPEDAQRLDAPPVFTPARVKISGPRSVIEAARRTASSQGQSLFVYANLGLFTRQFSDAGKHEITSVPVVSSVRFDTPNITLSPSTVSATIDVKKAEKTIVLPYVRVLAAYPDVIKADQFKAVYDSTISNVTVIGPEPQIALLQEQKYIPAAIFEVNYTDTENPAPAPLMFQLPAGVHVGDADAQRKINYTFKPRVTEAQ